jgi:hypothetical protein
MSCEKLPFYKHPLFLISAVVLGLGMTYALGIYQDFKRDGFEHAPDASLDLELFGMRVRELDAPEEV